MIRSLFRPRLFHDGRRVEAFLLRMVHKAAGSSWLWEPADEPDVVVHQLNKRCKS